MPRINHSKYISEILNLVQNILTVSPVKNTVIDKLNSNNEKSIEMDIYIENLVIDYIKSKHLPYQVFAEEGGHTRVSNNPRYYVTFDPLDGSTNYSVGKNFLPYGFLIAVYGNLEPKISDVICAGALEITNSLSWIYSEGKTLKLKDQTPTDITQKVIPDMHTPVYLDLYKKVNYDFYALFAQQVFIRNSGSSIGNLALTLEGVSTALGGSKVKPEEIGTIYALIKGAGGKIINQQGQDFGNITFSADNTYDILAGNPYVIDFLKRIIIKK